MVAIFPREVKNGFSNYRTVNKKIVSFRHHNENYVNESMFKSLNARGSPGRMWKLRIDRHINYCHMKLARTLPPSSEPACLKILELRRGIVNH